MTRSTRPKHNATTKSGARDQTPAHAHSSRHATDDSRLEGVSPSPYDHRLTAVLAAPPADTVVTLAIAAVLLLGAVGSAASLRSTHRLRAMYAGFWNDDF